ncbi:MAG: hypothetical protein JWQ57_3260 [Mucilaginibacter sp.]|nr:hypothetical protein [Mucilaginibacter sp.]
MLSSFEFFYRISGSTRQIISRILRLLFTKGFVFYIFLLIPLFSKAQQTDSLKKSTFHTITSISGRIVDDANGQPLPGINIRLTGSKYGTNSDLDGKFELNAPGSFAQVTFSYIGFQSVTRTIKPGQANVLQVRLRGSQTQLKEVKVVSGKKQRYRNKGNPAVELIQQIIDHKKQNRMESADYLQYDQYERINLSFIDVPSKMMNSRYFKMYKFMLDTIKNNGQTQVLLPAYFSEKQYQNYYRKNPAKSIRVLKAQKEANVLKFLDTAGLDVYMNRLYGNDIDIYDNNVFIITNQFLSPIADHSPNYYKFFITDTIQTAKEKLIELSFTPRAKGDLLFEGKLLVSMTGNYAVRSCELNVNKQININFMRTLKITLDFEQNPNGKYFLSKSDVKADFGILKSKGLGLMGERTVFLSNYLTDKPLGATFYDGKELQIAADANKPDTAYWAHQRPDTLSAQQARVYPRINKLEKMPQFKRATWVAATLTGGYAKWGPVMIGPIGATYAHDSQEGSRFQIGGRTTPELSKSIYFEGFGAYGLRDKVYKYNLATYFSFNKTAFYRYPNDYIKASYLYDAAVPGQNLSTINQQAALSSFSTGKTIYWLYNRIAKIEYVKDFESHFSFDLAFRNWNQRPASALVFQYNDAANTLVHDLTSSELNLAFRYAPHEQILQGTIYRRTIYSKYPILNLQINHSFKGLFNGSYNYTSATASIFKRFYLSQLGYADITVLGNYLVGKVPFPLLNISPANQSLAYDPDGYNQMTYLEFVSDHYAGINLTQSFNGFFLNKIPLIKHLKWREYLSAKVLFGGLRNENNPLYSGNLYRFPTGAGDANGTYALGNKPYVEAGVGIGNIFKFLRVDGIKRFNYLDHPGAAEYGVKFSFNPDF